LTTLQIAKLFRAKRVGRGKYMAHCPIHGRDRNASLEIKEGRNPGTTIVGCYAGCDKLVILGTVGLTLADLFADGGTWKPSPEMRQVWADEEQLKLLERQHGLAIMAQVVFPNERHYWRAVERNISVRGWALRDKLRPSEKKQREVEREVYRIIREYGLETLWECIPCSNCAKN